MLRIRLAAERADKADPISNPRTAEPAAALGAAGDTLIRDFRAIRGNPIRCIRRISGISG